MDAEGHGTQKQWKMAGEDFIDSAQHKRHRSTENNQRNDDHFLDGSSSKIDSSTKTSLSGHGSSESPGSDHVESSNNSSSSPDERR